MTPTERAREILAEAGITDPTGIELADVEWWAAKRINGGAKHAAKAWAESRKAVRAMTAVRVSVGSIECPEAHAILTDGGTDD